MADGEQLSEELDRVLVGGQRPTKVELVAYDPSWANRYAAERQRVEAALGDRAAAVHHIGSTAVPGLAAKDRVDVCLEVADPDDEAAYLADLVDAGYTLRVVEPGHRCLVRAEPATNLHVYAAGADEVRRYLRFRDQLRRDPADRAQYEDLKRSLADREWPDVNYYAEAKGELIREILGRASKVRIDRLTTPDQLDAAARSDLVDCWVAVTNAGGAVGFPHPPVTHADVHPAVESLAGELSARTCILFRATRDETLLGWVVLSRADSPLVGHWGLVQRLQTDPRHRGRGIGAALMQEAEQYARDELGLEQLHITVRAGLGLEHYYARLGWREVGRWPNALRLGPDDVRDEVLLYRTLDGQPAESRPTR